MKVPALRPLGVATAVINEFEAHREAIDSHAAWVGELFEPIDFEALAKGQPGERKHTFVGATVAAGFAVVESSARVAVDAVVGSTRAVYDFVTAEPWFVTAAKERGLIH